MNRPNTDPGPADTYRAARAKGRATDEACYEVMRVHGISGAEAADLSWHVETGGPAPAWLHEDGTETAASRAWSAGQQRAHVGDDE